MIEALRKLFTEPAGDDVRSPEDTRNLAAAALLIEVARADFTQDAAEEEAMANLLVATLGLERASIDRLIETAGDAVDSSTSLYEFTRLVNDHYSYEEKYALVTSMWRVAFADQELNKYEEHLIRRVADLIYLSHDDFIRGKLAATPS